MKEVVPPRQAERTAGSKMHGATNEIGNTLKDMLKAGIVAFARAMATPAEAYQPLKAADREELPPSPKRWEVGDEQAGSIVDMDSYELSYRISTGEITDPEALRFLMVKERNEGLQTMQTYRQRHPEDETRMIQQMQEFEAKYAPLITGSASDLATHIANRTADIQANGNWQTAEERQAATAAASRWYEMAGRLLASETINARTETRNALIRPVGARTSAPIGQKERALHTKRVQDERVSQTEYNAKIAELRGVQQLERPPAKAA